MTFNDIATQATSKVGKADTNSITQALIYAKNRYRVIWDSFTWPETIHKLATLTVPANQDNFFTDPSYGEIISIGWKSTTTVNPIRATYGDRGWIMANQPGVLFPGTSAILPIYYHKSQPLGLPSSALTSIVFNVIASGGDNVSITIHGFATEPVSGLSFETTETISISTGSPGNFSPVNNFSRVLSLSKTSGSSLILVKLNGSSTASAVLNTSDGKYEFNQYRFYPVPTSIWYLDLELKLRTPEENSISANDSPAIQSIENALLAYTQSDLLERQRQYQKAQEKTQEASILIQGAKDKSRNQADYFIQVTPEVYQDSSSSGYQRNFPSSSFF